MNIQSKNNILGKLGELLVQIRLLEHGVEAAPPLTDSGNDLIAVKGDIIKTFQIKTHSGPGRRARSNRKYDILVDVNIERDEEGKILLDQSRIYLRTEHGENEELDQMVSRLWG